jgi:hypothetical protein
MTTKITGTKMSKYATPFTSNWFLVNIPDEEGENNNTDTSNTLINSYSTLETSKTLEDIELQQNRANILYIMNRLINEGFIYNETSYKCHVYQASILCGIMDYKSKCNPEFEHKKQDLQGIRGWKVTLDTVKKRINHFNTFIKQKNYIERTSLDTAESTSYVNPSMYMNIESISIIDMNLEEQYDYMIYEIINYYPSLFNEYSRGPFFVESFSEGWTDNFDDPKNIEGIERAIKNLSSTYVDIPINKQTKYLPYVRKCYDLWQSQTKKS